MRLEGQRAAQAHQGRLELPARVQLGAEVGMGLRILRQQLRRLAQRRERILLLTQERDAQDLPEDAGGGLRAHQRLRLRFRLREMPLLNQRRERCELLRLVASRFHRPGSSR